MLFLKWLLPVLPHRLWFRYIEKRAEIYFSQRSDDPIDFSLICNCAREIAGNGYQGYKAMLHLIGRFGQIQISLSSRHTVLSQEIGVDDIMDLFARTAALNLIASSSSSEDHTMLRSYLLVIVSSLVVNLRMMGPRDVSRLFFEISEREGLEMAPDRYAHLVEMLSSGAASITGNATVQ